MKARLTTSEYCAGILQGDRVILGKAITLIESSRPADRAQAHDVLNSMLPNTGKSTRIGITGVPGVGKSTFIESFGEYLIHLGHRVAVLTIDPSSPLTRGSILGDKTRMETLARNPGAFIRPTASGDSLGGVASRTRETILLCEAAGFDTIMVETVGVGQSEIAVKKMVDFFLLLMLAGAGDELQGIKKGIMEMADAVVITKADGENKKKAREAQSSYLHALHLFQPDESGWRPAVLTSSALEKQGLAEIWKTIESFESTLRANDCFQKRRQQQLSNWMHEDFDRIVQTFLHHNQSLQQEAKKLEEHVMSGHLTPPQASALLWEALIKELKTSR